MLIVLVSLAYDHVFACLEPNLCCELLNLIYCVVDLVYVICNALMFVILFCTFSVIYSLFFTNGDLLIKSSFNHIL